MKVDYMKELKNRFFDFEKEYNLFHIQNENGLYYWDLCRYDIFKKIFRLQNHFKIQKTKHNSDFIFKKIPIYFKKVIKMFENELVLRDYLKTDYKYIFLIASRFIKDGKIFDNASNDFLEILKPQTFIIEKYNEDTENYYPYRLLLKRKFVRYLSESKKNNKISDLLVKEFNLNKTELNKLINYNIKKYYIDYYYYRDIINKINPKAIFVHQNGIQKALFAAANDIGISTIEFQHGIINKYHPQYSYNNKIDYNHLNTFPKYLFLLSEYWQEKFYYPSTKIVMGNNEFYSEDSTPKKEEDITTIIFSRDHTENLLKLSKEFSNTYEGFIYIKLHPNQYENKSYIEDEVSSLKNVKIITDELTIGNLLKKSRAIITITSTVVYEALQLGVKVFLLKKQNYYEHYDLFNNPNVYIINNSNEITKKINNEFDYENDFNFFRKFNEQKFRKFINEL